MLRSMATDEHEGWHSARSAAKPIPAFRPHLFSEH